MYLPIYLIYLSIYLSHTRFPLVFVFLRMCPLLSVPQISQVNYLLWVKYTAKRGDVFQQVIITLLVSSMVFIPFWFIMIQRVGKRYSFMIGLVLMLPTSIFMLAVPENCPLWLLHLSSAYGGLGFSVTYLLPWTMLPDVIDYDELQNGVRREALYYSFFVFFQKFAAGIAVALSTFSLELAGYITDPCCNQNQPDSLGNALRIIMGLCPLLFNILSFICTYFYAITPQFARNTKLQLEQMHRERAGETTPISHSSPSSDSKRVPVNAVVRESQA